MTPTASPERLPDHPEDAIAGRFARRTKGTKAKSKNDPDALLDQGVFIPDGDDEQ